MKKTPTKKASVKKAKKRVAKKIPSKNNTAQAVRNNTDVNTLSKN